MLGKAQLEVIEAASISLIGMDLVGFKEVLS